MLKKLMVGTLVTVLSTGIALGSVSAAPIDPGHTQENEIGVTIEGGVLDFTMDETVLAYKWTVDQSVEEITVNDPNGDLAYNIVDNRGIDDTITISYDLAAFDNGEGDTIVPNGDLDLTDDTFSPIDNPTIDDSINLSDITFDATDFVKQGEYSSTLTTTVEFTADIPEDEDEDEDELE